MCTANTSTPRAPAQLRTPVLRVAVNIGSCVDVLGSTVIGTRATPVERVCFLKHVMNQSDFELHVLHPEKETERT